VTLEQTTHPPATPALSRREQAVAEQFAAGLTYREIGEMFCIAPSTVRTHLSAIYQKLGVRTKVGLARQLADFAVPRRPAATSDNPVPVLAVLPFESHSDEPRWLRFADGLTADVVIDLARFSDLAVVASHTVRALGRSEGAHVSGRAVGADYVLAGQLRPEGERVRLTVQLSDVHSGLGLWSERYERPLDDFLRLQDTLAECIINVLAGCSGKLVRLGYSASRRKAPANLSAYDCYLLGMEQLRANNQAAIRLFTRAVELEPDLARAWMKLGDAYAVQANSGYSDDMGQSVRNWEAAVAHALLLDTEDSFAHWCMGDAKAALGDMVSAAEEHERALQLAPNFADTLVLVGGSRVLVLGDPVEGERLIQRALKLNPLAPPWYFGMSGRAHFVAGRYADSIAALRRGPSDSPATLLFLAMACAEYGSTEQSRAAAARLRTEFPDFSVDGFVAGYPVTNPAAVAAIHRGSAKAGLASAAHRSASPAGAADQAM
jgi:TolB-like protein